MVSETKIGRRIAKSGKGQTEIQRSMETRAEDVKKKAAESMTLMCKT